MVQPRVLLSLLEPAQHRTGRALGVGALVVRLLGVGRLVGRRVVEPSADVVEEAAAVAESEPEYGERVDETPTDETPDTKKSDD